MQPLRGWAGSSGGHRSFAERLGKAAVALEVSAFALVLLLAGAEPEELATGVIASARNVPAFSAR